MSNDSRVDLQRLAALMEGRLTSSDREQTITDISASDDMREVLALAAEAHEHVARPASRVGSPRVSVTAVMQRVGGRGARPWLMAAALLLVAGGVWVSRTGAERREASASPVLALADPDAGIPASVRQPPWPATRGGEASSDERSRAARIGVFVTDLELAIRNGDSAAVHYAEQIRLLLGAVPASGPALSLFTALARAPSTDASTRRTQLRAATDAAGQLLPEVFLELGRWGETARVARARGDTSFFHTPVNRAVIESALRSLEPTDPLRPVLERAKRVYDDPTSDWMVRAREADLIVETITR